LRKFKVNGALSAASRNGTLMSEAATDDAAVAPQEAALLAALGRRSVVLVGMMGAGKSSIGRRLAQRLGIGFVDADAEIEAAAGMTIAEIFASYGEPDFRSGEARVIARLLDQGHQVLATGGGAFMNPETRAGIRLKVFVRQENRIGKYTSFLIRAGAPPKRVDLCLFPKRRTPGSLSE